jgi:predicted glycoside hydrolase/deacetylase ChbG (UPF0249 family)
LALFVWWSYLGLLLPLLRRFLSYSGTLASLAWLDASSGCECWELVATISAEFAGGSGGAYSLRAAFRAKGHLNSNAAGLRFLSFDVCQFKQNKARVWEPLT